MTIPRLAAVKGILTSPEKGAVATMVPEDKPLFAAAKQALEGHAGDSLPLLGSEAFRGKEGESLVLFPRALKGRPLIVAGLGLTQSLSLERLRRSAALIARQASAFKQQSLSIQLPAKGLLDRLIPHSEEPSLGLAAGAVAEGAVLSVYAYDRYRSAPSPKKLSSITLLAENAADARAAGTAVALARVVIEGTWLARDLSNAPGNELFPESLAAAARQCGKRSGFSVKVFDRRRIERLKMGGLLGVAEGSARPPRFVILEYGRRRPGRKTVVLVGKGVTFDSGGISIKPSANMAEMKMDMAGAAAVLGTVQAVARLRLPVHLMGLIPATENLPGGRALKPGDILRHLNGRTSEIDNTDAEGRLILADALAYAGRYTPDAVIDLATLTGAVVVALGHLATGMFGNNPELMRRLKESGERTYERVWELPMFEEYASLIKSDIADAKNTGGRWAGAITAAMFLKNFVGDVPWVHLDIAGTAIMEEQLEYIPKGGSGVGVRLLVDMLRRWHDV